MGLQRLLGGLILFASAAALADEPKNEITGFGSFRFGGSLEVEASDGNYDVEDDTAFGLIFNRRHSSNTQWELYFSRQDTRAEFSEPTSNDPVVDLRSTALQLGGTYLGNPGRVQPYLALTLGGTHVEARSSGSEDDTYWSGSIGVGIRAAPSARAGLRLEVRGHGVLTRSDSDLLCQTGPDLNVCAITLEGGLFRQLEVFVGAVLRF